jgi:hypothetical protein
MDFERSARAIMTDSRSSGKFTDSHNIVLFGRWLERGRVGADEWIDSDPLPSRLMIADKVIAPPWENANRRRGFSPAINRMAFHSY